MNKARQSFADSSAIGERANRQDLIADQQEALWDLQQDDGHIVFELEADCTIPAEFLIMCHFLGEIDPAREGMFAAYIRELQNDDGSWPLFHGGAGDISASVKAYWALKLTGADPLSGEMQLARDWILAQGGAATANVFTRISMATFGHVPWRAVPVMPVECMLLPRWFPFHMSKIAYWSRTVVTPILVLYAMRAKAANPTDTDIRELFTVRPEDHRTYNVNPTGSAIGNLFLRLDKGLRMLEPRLPKGARAKAIRAAEQFTIARLNGDNGLGAIFPAMTNAVMMFHTLGYACDNPHMRNARQALDRLMVERHGRLYPQPCLSPVWDTALSAHALLEAGNRCDAKLTRALDWLADRQILDHVGDWGVRRPNLRPGGWAFQYENPDYPDVDDTAVVAMAMHRADAQRYAHNIDRACEWIAGMQSKNGGWGAFDPENEHGYLNSIPFADHGALLDPPTVDVTARCVGCLAQIDAEKFDARIQRGIRFIKREQEADGSWFGRWGANYIYGTWSALAALNAADQDMTQPYIARSVDWLLSQQRPDGGWGEGLESYDTPGCAADAQSTPSQTAWALLGLMSAGQPDCDAVARGVAWLENAPRDGARWREHHFTGTGFPRVFYLKYHGYSAFFPLWALARYETLSRSNDRQVVWGI